MPANLMCQNVFDIDGNQAFSQFPLMSAPDDLSVWNVEKFSKNTIVKMYVTIVRKQLVVVLIIVKQVRDHKNL